MVEKINRLKYKKYAEFNTYALSVVKLANDMTNELTAETL